MPTPLFIAGVGRSGTTALVEVMGAHPQMALGIERFKALWRGRLDEMTAELFTRERFFDFEDGLTNVVPAASPHWDAYYRQQRQTFDQAVYVGDKMTTVRPEQLWTLHPEARLLFIVRDVAEVAGSWDVRARNEADATWPAKLGGERALRRWNRDTHRIRRSVRRRPEQAAVVEYRSFFADPEARSLRRVLEWLDLEASAEILDAFDEHHRRFVTQVATKDRTLRPEVQALVDQHADQALWRSVCDLAL